MSSLSQRINTFVTRHKEELTEDTGVDELCELLLELFNSFQPRFTFKEKVNFLLEHLQSETALFEGDTKNYLERLVKFVDVQEDLDKNNIKSSASDSSDDDEKDHAKFSKKRDRSRDKEKNKKSKKSKSTNNSKVLSVLQKLDSKRLTELVNILTKKNDNTKNNQNRNIVFMMNLPKELRNYKEIEAMLAQKGQIARISLTGRSPSVLFQNPKDAQNLLEKTKHIVYKGIKVDFSPTPTRRREPHEEQTEAKKVIVLETEPKKPAQEPAASAPIEQEGEEKKPQTKEEHELQKSLDQLRSQAKSLISEKMRLVLLLSKRSEYYTSQINSEIESLKKLLVAKKNEIDKITQLDSLKKEVQWLNENYDYTLEVQDLPEQHFKDKTINKVLNEYYTTFGKIETLVPNLKERTARLKFSSFESAERAYLSPTQQFKIDFLHKGIKSVIKA